MAKIVSENKSRMGELGLEITTVDKMVRDLSVVGTGVIMALAALIGIWGFACLFGGLVQSGGVGELINGFLSAVTGR